MPDRTVNLEIHADQAEDVLRRILPAMLDYVVDITLVEAPAAEPCSYVVGAVGVGEDRQPTVTLFPWDDDTDAPDRRQPRTIDVAEIATLAVV